MKYALALLFLLASVPLAAQSLLVGKVPLDAIDTDYLEVQVFQWKLLDREQIYLIHFGQDCMEQAPVIYNREFLAECLALQYEDGTLYRAFHYTKVLTLLAEYGWEVVDLELSASEGNSSSDTAIILLKRKE